MIKEPAKKGIGAVAGILFFIGLTQSVFAESLQMTPELAARFEKLEAQISTLETQMTEQDKRHREEVEGLKRQIEIKAPAEEKSVYVSPAAEKGPKWLEGLEMGGDIRLRYEAFHHNSEAVRDQNRFRYRVRWKTVKHLTKDLDVGFRIVSGPSADPASTNQTLSGDFTFKNIFVDQVYAKYQLSPLTERIPHLKKAEIAGGKVENPFYAASTSMVWDPDVTPEGFYESLEFGFFKDRLKPFVNVGQFILQENVTAPSDAELYGVQTGLRWVLPGASEKSGPRFTNAFAFYDFSDYARNSNFTVSGTSLANGNTTLGSTHLAAGQFHILQFYNDVEFKVKNFPVKLFTDFATNLGDQTPEPDNRNHAYEYGLKLGNAKQKGDWELTYYYAYIEPNAVVGAFNESDLGVGHSDKKGNVVQLKYKLTDSLKVGLNGFFVENVTGANDYTSRFSSDLEWAF